MNNIKSRIFIVGAPRSGTTLLQSLLAAHPQITSFPESHFFENLIICRRPWSWLWVYLLGLTKPKAISRFNLFLEIIGQEHLQKRFLDNALFAHKYASDFIEILDTITKKQNRSIWLEKTPLHLHCIEYIEKLIPDAKFIHIIRNGADVIASQYDAASKDREVWRDRQNIDRCIELWVEDVQTSLNHLHKHNHALVKYENLVKEPQSVVEELCKFLEITFKEVMLKEYSTTSDRLILKRELAWKNSVAEPIQNANGKKFYELFNEQQRQYIFERLSQVDVARL